VEGGRPALGLLMIGGIRAGSNSSVEGWGTEGAGHELGIGTAGVPAPSEILKIVHGHRGSAIREDVRQPMLIAERRLWRERFAFDARTDRGDVEIFFRVIVGWWQLGGGWRERKLIRKVWRCP
jgi:hypothetical protein